MRNQQFGIEVGVICGEKVLKLLRIKVTVIHLLISGTFHVLAGTNWQAKLNHTIAKVNRKKLREPAKNAIAHRKFIEIEKRSFYSDQLRGHLLPGY